MTVKADESKTASKKKKSSRTRVTKTGTKKTMTDGDSLFSVFWTWLHSYQNRIGVLIAGFTLLVAAVGVWATFNQIRISGANFQTQMAEQRRATAVLIVSDFMNQIGALSVDSATKEDAKFDRMLVSRTQLLLNTLGDSDLKAQIVQYLASGGFQRVFTSDPTSKNPTINMKGVHLDNGNFRRVDFKDAVFNCTSFKNSVFEFADFSSASIVRSDFSNSSFSVGSVFDNSKVQWSSFRNSYLAPGILPQSASIILSDLREMSFGDEYLESSLIAVKDDGTQFDDGPWVDITKDEVTNSDIVERNAYEVATLLKNSETLFGTLLDSDVETALHKILGSERFNEVRKKVPDNLTSSFASALSNDRPWDLKTINNGFCGDV